MRLSSVHSGKRGSASAGAYGRRSPHLLRITNENGPEVSLAKRQQRADGENNHDDRQPHSDWGLRYSADEHSDGHSQCQKDEPLFSALRLRSLI